MIDEQALREFANTLISEPVSRSIEEIECAGEFIKVLLDELQSLRSERTAWRVSAENAEAAVKQARIDALNEVQKSADAISVDKWALFKGRDPYMGHENGRASDFTQGQADGADLVSQAIDAMKETP